VRKRLLPIAAASSGMTGSSSSQRNLPFVPVEESVTAKRFYGVSGTVSSEQAQTRIESGHSVLVSPEASKTVVAGEVISASPRGDIGVALVRLTDVLTKDDTSPTGVSTVARVQCVNSVGTEDGAKSTAAEASTAGTTKSAAGTVALDVVVVRPPWWVDTDPVTGKRVDTLDVAATE
jgi:hypothetical protein